MPFEFRLMSGESSMTKIAMLALATGVFVGVGMVNRLDAQDFRVVSQVFIGDSNSPSSENLTLYQGGVAYDFQMNLQSPGTPSEIVVYDSRNKQIVLLDMQREMRTDIAEFELLKMLEGLRETAEINEDTNFLLNPQLASEFDINKSELTVSNEDMTYLAHGEAPENLVGMPLFYEAMDQFTRLSASDPRRLPPFARLVLNQEIRKHGLFPKTIHMSMRAGAITREKFVARSSHAVAWELSEEDAKRIQSAKNHWMSFEKVSIATYRELGEPQATLRK